MTPAEASQVLAIAAGFDNRKPDPVTARTWAAALDGYRLADCEQAIIQHYRRSREWMMPFDVISGVKRIRYERLEAHIQKHGPLQPPADLDPDDTGAYADWLHEEQMRIANGDDEPPALEAS
ncbi:MAG TPA: hypothetical protein VF062_05015 [Candidatus Limnocylindrales bacterium]